MPSGGYGRFCAVGVLRTTSSAASDPVGPFIVDFACVEHRLVIEADGGQHADSEYDARRSAWLEARGWRVLRFWNNENLANTEGVQEAILQALREAAG
jgi:very-short-patch-repair endonuclease